MNLAGSVVLVTGASSGIGAAAADLLAARGARLLLSGRDRSRLQEVGGPDAARHPCDLARPGAAEELAEWAETETDGVDVLVANAGQGLAAPLTGTPAADVERLVTVNLTTNIALTRLLLPGMQRRGYGHLAFVSSIAGHMGVAGESVYSATKAGINGFADSVRHETAGTGVGVSVLVPGIVDTAFFSRRGLPGPGGIPRPVPAGTAAGALLDAIDRGREEVFVPRWLRWPARLHGAAPSLIGTVQRRLRP